MKHGCCLIFSIIVVFSSCGVRVGPQEKWEMFTGYKIGIHNETIVVGTTYHDYAGGYITFFDCRDAEWEQTAFFDLTQLAKGYRGPVSIQVNERHAVIGLDGKRGTPGAILLFNKENGKWHAGALFQAPDKEADDKFGFITSLYEDTLVVGVDTMNVARGAVYIYDIALIEPILIQQIINKYGERIEFFGSSVCLFENMLVIASSGYNYEKNKTLKDKLPKGKIDLYGLKDNEWKVRQSIYGYYSHSEGLSLGERVSFDNVNLITDDCSNIFHLTKNAQGIFENPIEIDNMGSRIHGMALSGSRLALNLRTGNTTSNAVSRVSLLHYNGIEWALQNEFLHKDFKGGTRLYFGAEIAIYDDLLLITDPTNSPGSMDVQMASPAPGKVYIIRLAEDGTYKKEGAIMRWYDKKKVVFGVVQKEQ